MSTINIKNNCYSLNAIGSPKYMVQKYRNLFYDKDKHKIVPKIILNGSKEIKEWFFDGYYNGDGYKTNGYRYIIGELNNFKIECKNKITALGLYYICQSIGYKNSNNCSDSYTYR